LRELTKLVLDAKISIRSRSSETEFAVSFFTIDIFWPQLSCKREKIGLFELDEAILDKDIQCGTRVAFTKLLDSNVHKNSPWRYSMEDADIEQRFHLMQKEIEATVSLMTESKLDLKGAIDSLRIELEVLKIYMQRYHPGFAESYPKFKEEAIQAIDPEWIGSESAKRLGGR
jgi:hypothetical protein